MRPGTWAAFLITMVTPLSGCQSSDQPKANQAIRGTIFERCLADAHWVPAIRKGVLSISPMGGGVGFRPTDSKALSVADASFAVVLVGDAQVLFDRPVEDFEKSFEASGSPNNTPSLNGPFSDINRPMLQIIKQINMISVSGIAKGWLSKESQLYCGTDMQNGRYFIIDRFEPSFDLRNLPK